MLSYWVKTNSDVSCSRTPDQQGGNAGDASNTFEVYIAVQDLITS